MANLLIVVIPFLAACIFVACTLRWLSVQEKRRKKFAAAEGIAYRRGGQAPIVVPQMVYGKRTINEMNKFFYGYWNGFEVFACDFRIGWRRGNVVWLFMVAVHAELHDTSGVDLKRWNLTPLNGWIFLIPKKPNGGTLNIRKLRALWNALSATAQRVPLNAIVKT